MGIYQSKANFDEKILFRKITHLYDPKIRKMFVAMFIWESGIPRSILVHDLSLSIGRKILLAKSTFVCKHDSARKLNGFLLLSDVAFPQANQMAGKGRCKRNIPPTENQVL